MTQTKRTALVDRVDDDAVASILESTIDAGVYGLVTVGTDGGPVQSGIYNSDGEQINSFGSPQLNGTHRSPVHFTTTYTSTSTLTLGGAPTISDNSQIVGIQVTSVGNVTTQYIAGADGVSFGVSGSIITAYKAGVAYEIFASNDIAYRVVLNLRPIAQDQDLDSTKTAPQNNVPDIKTDEEILVTAQDLTASYADFGSEIDVRSKRYLGVWVIYDVNDSDDVDLQVLGKFESGGTDEFEIDGIAVKRIFNSGDSDNKVYYEFDTGTIKFVQLQAIAGTVGATAGDLTIYINKYNV